MRWCLVVALAVLVPVWAQAQEDPGREARKARERAMRLAGKALKGLVRYAQEAPPGPLDPEEALQRALERLEGPLEPEPEEPPEELEPEAAYDLLRQYRDALQERLRRLAPKRHPAPAPEPAAEYVLRFHDVRDLLQGVEDHVGPNMGLGVGLDESGAGDALPEEHSGLEPDQLEELVTSSVGEELWDDPASIEIEGGQLIVNQTAAVQERIAALLARLRQAWTGLVELELRLYRLPAAVHDALGAGAVALDAAGEQALQQAVERKQAALLATHRLVAHDGQRVNVHRGSARSILAAMGVDESGVVPVVEPVVSALELGHVVEVRPLVDRVRERVLLDVAVGQCEAVEPWERRKVDGDELDLPRIRLARTSSTTLVPLGRGALVGGLLAQGGEDDPLATVVYVRATLLGGE